MTHLPRIAFLFLALPLLLSCGFQMGPAHPERDGTAFLKKRGYTDEVIGCVTTIQKVDADMFARLVKEESRDVKFLVAQNPHLPPELLRVLISDADDFVRGGAALNPNLSAEQIQELSNDPSHTTRLYIARNPHVPEEVLIELHEQRGMELVWFAMNPKCPERLKSKMQKLNDEDALYWLNVTSKR